jgi:hypothetical protein
MLLGAGYEYIHIAEACQWGYSPVFRNPHELSPKGNNEVEVYSSFYAVPVPDITSPGFRILRCTERWGCRFQGWDESASLHYPHESFCYVYSDV